MGRTRRATVRTGQALNEQVTREYNLIGGKMRITAKTVFPLPANALAEFDGLADSVRTLQREAGLSEAEDDDDEDEDLPEVTRQFRAAGRRT